MVIMGGLIIAALSMLVQGNETRTYFVLLVFGARLCARWITVFPQSQATAARHHAAVPLQQQEIIYRFERSRRIGDWVRHKVKQAGLTLHHNVSQAAPKSATD